MSKDLTIAVINTDQNYNQKGIAKRSKDKKGNDLITITVRNCPIFKRYVMQYRIVDGACRIDYERNSPNFRAGTNAYVKVVKLTEDSLSLIWCEDGTNWIVTSEVNH